MIVIGIRPHNGVSVQRDADGITAEPRAANADLDQPHPHQGREQPNEPCHRCRYETALYKIHG
jgi:hypothetical protein